MIIGVDFDNTIVCYDGIFHAIALERGLIPTDLPTDKVSVRDYLRQTGQEEAWTELQGFVYGPRLIDASPYPGVIDFFSAAIRAGISVRIISHKTRHPFLGEPHDLHAAAWNWLELAGVLGSTATSLNREHVFFEESMEAKFLRIQSEGCTHFIDDLPEFLRDARFPQSALPILFDPSGTPSQPDHLQRTRSWMELDALLLPERPTAVVNALAQAVLGTHDADGSALNGGANNRVYRFKSSSSETILKAYHQSSSDERDRFSAEQNFYNLLQAVEMPSTPAPLAWDAENRLCAMSVVSGCKLAPGEVTDSAVIQCIEWLIKLQGFRGHPLAERIQPAADACFSISAHLSLVERRVNRLLAASSSMAHGEFTDFVQNDLLPHVTKLSSEIRARAGASSDEPFVQEHRILSPSDFGFHNAIRGIDGKFWFLDFEYAGWDDPVKLLCDFFCQPQIPVSLEYAPEFVRALEEAVGEKSIGQRFKQLLPLHAAKWSCILLNEFLPSEANRRLFAGVKLTLSEMRSVQLEKARRMLAVSQSLSSSSI